MKERPLNSFWKHPLARAAAIHLGLLGGGGFIAAMIASGLGLSVSVLGLLVAYGVVNIALTAWLLRRRSAASVEEEADETADALAAFAQEPLGTVIGDAKDRLAGARRAVGRNAAMYQTMDRLVRVTRRIERRLALEPDLRPGFSRNLNRDLPVIAATAEQYVRLKDEALPKEQEDRLIVAEGVLREAADRLDELSRSDGKIDSATVGLIRMDANAEFLAESLSADTGSASRRASALRTSHALRRASKHVGEELAVQLRALADHIDGLSAADDDALSTFLATDSGALIEKAETVIAGDDANAEASLRGHIATLSLSDSNNVPAAKTASS